MSGMRSLEVKADLDNLGRVRDFIEDSAGAAGLTGEGAGELVLAIDEAVSNIIMHGFQSGDGDIEVEVAAGAEAVLVHIRDNAPLFDPTRDTNPHLEISPLERDSPGGFGLHLLNHLVDEITYRVTEDGRNELVILKKRP